MYVLYLNILLLSFFEKAQTEMDIQPAYISYKYKWYLNIKY